MKKYIPIVFSAAALVGILAPVPAKAAVKLNSTKLYMFDDTTSRLSVLGTNKKITWSSTNKSVASVDSRGKISAKKNGTAVIKAKYDSKTLYCTVYVMELNYSSLELSANEGATLKVVKPSAVKGAVTWSSSDSSIATVNGSGYVKGKNPGLAKITAKCQGKTSACKIYIPSLSLSKTEYKKGETGVASVKNTISKISFVSSNPSVASIDNTGKITAKSAGDATITSKGYNAKGKCITTLSKTIHVYDTSSTSVEIVKGKTKQISVSNAGSIPWASNNSSVATVSSSGLITAKNPGTCTIKGTYKGMTFEYKVSVPSFSVSKSAITVGGNGNVSVKNFSDKVTYTSSNSNILSIDSSGNYKGISSGKATITAHFYDGSTLLGEMEVSVSVSDISKSEVVLKAGEKTTLSMSNASNVSWSSSNTSVASVNQNGEVTANAGGTCTITANVNGGTRTCNVYVPALSQNSISLSSRNTATITLNNYNGSVTYSSDKPYIANCVNGVITPYTAGTCTVTVTADGKTFPCKVTVTNPEIVKQFFSTLEDTAREIKASDIKYDGSHSYPTLESAETYNCATYVAWTLQRMQMIPAKKVFYFNSAGHGAGYTYMTQHPEKFQIIKQKKRVRNSDLKPGDICGFQINGSAAHTAVYAGKTSGGNPKWYSAGRTDFAKLVNNDFKPVRFDYYDNGSNDIIYTIVRLK